MLLRKVKGKVIRLWPDSVFFPQSDGCGQDSEYYSVLVNLLVTLCIAVVQLFQSCCQTLILNILYEERIISFPVPLSNHQ